MHRFSILLNSGLDSGHCATLLLSRFDDFTNELAPCCAVSISLSHLTALFGFFCM